MTNIGDLLGNAANELLQSSINVGDVYLLNLDPSNGITPRTMMPHAINSSSFLDLTKKEM